MALPTSHNKILQEHRQEIVSTIHPNTLLPLLLNKKLVTQEEFREISEDSSRLSDGQRNGKLLDIVTKKGAHAFDLFVSALKDEEKHLGHESLAKKLEEEKAKLPKPQSHGHRRQDEDVSKFTMILEDAVHRQQQGSSNLELAVLTSMQASLQQLNTRVGTLETDLRAVKDVTKEIKHAEQINETRMSFSMQSVYEKLEYIQNELSTILTLPKMLEQEEDFEHDSVISQVNRPMQESRMSNENSYITATSHHKQLKNASLEQARSSREYAEPYEVFDFSKDKRAQSLDSLNTISPKSSSSSIYKDTSNSIDPSSKMPYYANITHSIVGSPRVCRRKLMPQQVFKYQQLEINIAIYKPKQKMAEGKSGEFWESVNSTDGSTVVVKYPKVQDKFKIKEIAALTRISHPNVIKLIGISTLRSPIALIMEYIDNGNLLSFLRSNKSSLKASKLLTLAESIARGMVQLEYNNIVHCDLTAHSILIDSHLVCKISSFDNSLCLNSTSGSVTLPENVQLLLPLKWCAPEVFSERKFSTKSDVWSYSVVLYEIFSMGAPPYSGKSNGEIRDFVTKRCVMAKPSSSFPSNIYELMQNCFKFVPIDRPGFTHIYKTLKSFHGKKKGGLTRENITADDYGTI